MAFIVRIDSKSCHTRGWQAREYTSAPKYVSKFFSDSIYGGKHKAYIAAQQALPALKRRARRTQAMEKVG